MTAPTDDKDVSQTVPTPNVAAELSSVSSVDGASEPSETELLIRQVVARYLADIASLQCEIAAHDSEIGLKIQSLTKEYSNGVRLTSGLASGAFAIDKILNTIWFDIRPLLLLCEAIATHPATIDYAAYREMVRAVTEIYLSHELLHIPQGLEEMVHVDVVKRLGGNDMLGRLDSDADNGAARFCAALNSARKSAQGRLAFLTEFYMVSLVRDEIPPLVFRAPADKPHKRRRFAGNILGSVILRKALEHGIVSAFEATQFRLDSVIYPYFDVQSGEAVFTVAPAGKILTPDRKIPVQVATEFLESLDQGQLGKSLELGEVIVEYFPALRQTKLIVGSAQPASPKTTAP